MCRFLELAKVLFQTLEAEGTEYHYDQKCYSQPKNNSQLFAVIGTQHRRPVELFLRLQQQRFLFTELFLNNSSSSCACVRDSVQVAPGGAENTHCNTHKRHQCLRRNYRQFFGSSFTDVNGVQTERTERPDVEAPQKYPSPAACASHWRQPSLFGDDTHAVVTRPKWAREHGVHTEWSPMSVGCEPGPSIGARTRTRAEVNVRPRPLVQVNRRPVLLFASAPVLVRAILCWRHGDWRAGCHRKRFDDTWPPAWLREGPFPNT